jgi:hypothetical protein
MRLSSNTCGEIVYVHFSKSYLRHIEEAPQQILCGHKKRQNAKESVKILSDNIFSSKKNSNPLHIEKSHQISERNSNFICLPSLFTTNTPMKTLTP